MAREYRIIKINAPSRWGTDSQRSKDNWYVVQYRNVPSFFNKNPKWKNIYYNEKDVIYYDRKIEAPTHSTFWDEYGGTGYLIYGLNAAKHILDLVRLKRNDEANDSFSVVYQTIRTKKEATDKMAELIAKYNELLDH